MKTTREPTVHLVKKPEGISSKEPRDLDPLVLEPPMKTKGIELEIRKDSKMVVKWINGKAKQKTTVGAVGVAQKHLRELWSKGVDFRRRVDDWAVHIFRNTTKKLTPGRKGRSEAELTNGWR